MTHMKERRERQLAKYNHCIDRFAEFFAELVESEKRVTKLETKCSELLEALKPFAILAGQMLKTDGRSSANDKNPVYGCNSATITVGDCRTIVKAIKSVEGK